MPCLTLLSVILFSFKAMAGVHDSIAGPFALSISPSTITASRFDQSGSLDLLKFPASSEYMQYYHEIATNTSPDYQGASQSESEIMSKFQRLIAPVTEDLYQRLGSEPQYGAIFVPSILESIVDLDASYAIPNKNKQEAFKSGFSRMATCPGYGFLDCKNLGRRAEQCRDEDPENLVLVLEYEKEHLYAWLMQVGFEVNIYYTLEKNLCPDCGELKNQAMDARAYEDRLSAFIEGFLESQVFPEHKREDIRAIIISGEASPAGSARLGAIAVQGVGTDEVRLMTEIDPSEVVAYGAAVWVQQTQKRPQAFIPHDGNRVADEQYHIDHEAARRRHEHDEL